VNDDLAGRYLNHELGTVKAGAEGTCHITEAVVWPFDNDELLPLPEGRNEFIFCPSFHCLKTGAGRTVMKEGQGNRPRRT